MNSSRSGLRPLWTALRAMAVMTLLLGLAYPLAVTGVGQLAFPGRANGSVAELDGAPVGSSLIGQSFTDDAGQPLPEWFQPRPSAAGSGYDAGASGGSNLGPENPELSALILERRAQAAEFNDVDPDQVPVDALTASSSGLDPHISPEYAQLQAERVASARGMSAERIRALVAEHTRARDLGYLGEPTVNVLELNIALEGLED